MAFHPLLLRQLKRFNIDPTMFNNSAWQYFLEHISKIYFDNDQDRYTIERSLEISSQEMLDLREKLQKEKEILQSVVSEGICVLDQFLRIVSLNSTAATLLNCLPETAKDKSYADVFNLYDKEITPVNKILLAKISYDITKPKFYALDHAFLKTFQGITFPVSFSFNPILLSSNPMLFEGAVLVFKDISEQVRAEQALRNALLIAEQSSKAKALFLATMSHEIRTPMHGILGMLHILQNTQLSADQRNYVDKTFENSNNLLRIVDDILDFSKIEAGMVSFEQTDFDLKEELNSMLMPLNIQCQKKNLELVLKYDDKIPSPIISDPLRLQQIINNIVNNAIKFTPANGSIIIDVTSLCSEADELTLQFAISDNGIGISPEAQERIFGVFSQADDSITRNYGGTGLGLTIVKQLVMHMGGNVTVKSSKGSGSTFTVTIKVGTKKLEKPANFFEPPSLDYNHQKRTSQD